MTTTRKRKPPRCFYCRSEDTMVPFRRSQHVFLLSRVFPIRWRYCRRCTRHFLDFRAPRARP